jgi:hypothetical protein
MKKIDYKDLNSKQQESYNYQKISGLLAEYGYITYRMHDDYHGADFHAVHVYGDVLKVQLKGRVTIDKKYLNKGIYIAFSNDRNKWYLYPHDELYITITDHSSGAKLHGGRSIHYVPKWLLPIISKYELN